VAVPKRAAAYILQLNDPPSMENAKAWIARGLRIRSRIFVTLF